MNEWAIRAIGRAIKHVLPNSWLFWSSVPTSHRFYLSGLRGLEAIYPRPTRWGEGSLSSTVGQNNQEYLHWSTGPLARPFARSFAPFTRSLAPHYSLCSCAPLRSLRSLPSSWDSDWLDVFFPILAHREIVDSGQLDARQKRRDPGGPFFRPSLTFHVTWTSSSSQLCLDE